MFTGLLPSEHGANNKTRYLDGRFETIAELFEGEGYATYLFSANPNIQFRENFHQGFDVTEHPWDPARREAALAILRDKVQGDKATGFAAILGREEVDDVHLKACGQLANEALIGFLGRKEPSRPYFAFVNYMEAHDPLLPPRSYRERFLPEDLVEQSYTRNRSWRAGWEYTYGLRPPSPHQLELHSGVYDAALAELDDLLRDLITRLEAAGHLEDTIVVLTSDHGEHLGDHRIVGHRYSLYEELLRIPLVLHAPGRIQSGRSSAPATNMDLFRTLLALANIAPPSELPLRSLDLRDVPPQRVRVAEYPGDFPIYASHKNELVEGFDELRWTRRMRAVVEEDYKLIWASDGRHELYSLTEDPGETRDLSVIEGEVRDRLIEDLEVIRRDLTPHVPATSKPDTEFVRQLEGIGY
jgi:arylsulfatase A-like enzyme